MPQTVGTHTEAMGERLLILQGDWRCCGSF